jgi:hypothetical protein
MSTAAASKNSSGGVGGWLILLVGIVLAYGAGAGGEGLSIGSGSGSRAGAGTAAASNPCPPNEVNIQPLRGACWSVGRDSGL